MKALLLGFGDLALRLAPKLLAENWQVTGLRRRPVEPEGLVDNAGFSMTGGDLRDPAVLERALAGTDAVVVTLTPDSFSEEGYRRTYVDGARALADAVGNRLHRPGYLIWVSSTSVYGQNRGEWVDEDTVAEPRSFSGRALLAAEETIRALPVPGTIVRFSGIYGPGRDRQLSQVRRGAVAAPQPRVWTNRIHSEDCAGVLSHLLSRYRHGIANPALLLATDCQPAPRHEVQSWLAARLGVAVAPQQIPLPERGNRRCCNRRLREIGYRLLYPDYRRGYRALLDNAE